MTHKEARNVLIEGGRRAGKTYAALAKEFDISEARVGQILAKREMQRRIIAMRLERPLRGPRR